MLTATTTRLRMVVGGLSSGESGMNLVFRILALLSCAPVRLDVTCHRVVSRSFTTFFTNNVTSKVSDDREKLR